VIKHKLKIRSLARGLLLLFLSLAPAQTQAQQAIASIDNFQTPILYNSRTTYLDLIQKVFPSAQVRADGTGARAGKSIALNHLFGDYRRRIFEGEMNINYARTVRIRDGGREQLLLLLDVSSEDGELFQWGGMSVLALFSTGSESRLLDAVDVQADRFTFFAEKQTVLRIHAQRDAVLLVNHHFNSGDGYLAYSLIGVVNNRLKDIFPEMPLLVGDNHCGTNFTETPDFNVLKNSANGYRRIGLRIKLVKESDGPGCERRTRGFTKSFDY
jgi:hypothetical protein